MSAEVAHQQTTTETAEVPVETDNVSNVVDMVTLNEIAEVLNETIDQTEETKGYQVQTDVTIDEIREKHHRAQQAIKVETVEETQEQE